MPYVLFDSHFHIIDRRFPLVENQGYLPPEFTCAHYLARMREHRVLGGAIVSGSFQGFDQTYLVEALAKLGPSFVGVTQLPSNTSDEDLRGLHDAGVRAVRFNLKRGGSEDVRHLEKLAHRVHAAVGWHVEFYVDAAELKPLRTLLSTLPAVSIDHLGLSRAGFPTLLELAAAGVHVKATGFGRVDFDVGAAIRELHAANPNALMFGTDLPSTRAPRPYEDGDLELIAAALDSAAVERVLWRNALELYRPRTHFSHTTNEPAAREAGPSL